MAAYIARRLIWMVFLLFTITLITFIIFSVLPSGDPAVQRAGRQPSPEAIELVRQRFGLDKPLPVQFINYIGDLLPFVGGNGVYFGFSFQNNTDVLPEILKRLPATIFLTFGAVVIWLAIGIPLGVLSAIRSRLRAGSARDGLRADLHLGAGLLLRPRRAVPVRHPRSASSRCCRATRSTRRRTASSGKPGTLIMPWCVLGRGVRGDLRALLERQPDRHAAGGLHPHRAGEGPVRETGDLPPRGAVGDHADRHAARPRHRHPARRRDPHRDRVQHPGDRPLRVQRDRPVGSAGDPGHRAVRCVLHRVACR